LEFDSLPVKCGSVSYEGEDLRQYPQVLRGSPGFCWEEHSLLGYTVDQATTYLTRQWRYVSVDSRVHMLMKGMYPCIPGWHCDDFFRPQGGQPDLLNAPPSEHVFVVLGKCSLTRFVARPLSLPLDYEGTLYGTLHKRIEALAPETFQVGPGEFWRFTQKTLHRGEPAAENGWRVFIRVTGSDHWEPVNELRTQTQVYLTAPFKGW
jgi:hypothetical protein